MNVPQWKRVDWSQFDDFCGDTSGIANKHEAAFPFLLECLTSADVAVAKDGCTGIGQWPFESVEVMGRVGAVPTVIKCICDMLQNGMCPCPEIALDAIVWLKEGVVRYPFFKRFFAGARVSLWEDVVRAIESHFDLFCELSDRPESGIRFHAVTLLTSCERHEVAPLCRHRIDKETDHRIVRLMARALGTLCDPDHRQVLLDLSTGASHVSVRNTAREMLSRASRSVPNPWLRELCCDAIRHIDPTHIVEDGSESAVDAIESLSQDAWAYAVAFWMDHLDSLVDHAIIDSMHWFLKTILWWHWERGFFAYVNGEISWILQVTLGYLTQCDEYWAFAAGSHSKELEHLLGRQFGLPFERSQLRTHFGRFH